MSSHGAARTTARRRLPSLAVLVTAATIVAGCSSEPAATDAGGSGTQETARRKAVRFAACMRDHGVGAFPDPDASGEMTVDGVLNGSSLDASAPAWTTAIAACKDLQPPGFTGRKRTGRQQEAALAFARCMREHGVPDFPDPTEGGPLIDTNRIPSAAGRGALEIPGFQAAQDACSEPATRALEGR